MYTKQEVIDIFNNEVEENDRELINATLLAIRHQRVRDQLETNLSKIFKDVSERTVVASVLLSTPGDFDSIMDFASNVGSTHYIDYGKFLLEDTVQDITEWFTGDDYALEAFKQLTNVKTSSKGPGEVALATMGPNLINVGDKSDPGDFTYISAPDKPISLELKAANSEGSSGGRLHDQTKSKYDWSKCYGIFSDNNINTVNEKITLNNYIKDHRDRLSNDQKELIAETVIDASFKFITDTQKLKEALVNGSSEEIKKEWGVQSFYNYKNYAHFDKLIMIDFYSGKSVVTEDLRNIEDDLKFGTVIFCGNHKKHAREIMPQINIIRPKLEKK